ncbi:hypothetical protein L2D14_01230 [Thalassospiraceae bacterium LMO-JJ14]|nr:hypothetical protein L2D14_01230 [Thalassospiraceae bacterium LMO-JJ14]
MANFWRDGRHKIAWATTIIAVILFQLTLTTIQTIDRGEFRTLNLEDFFISTVILMPSVFVIIAIFQWLGNRFGESKSYETPGLSLKETTNIEGLTNNGIVALGEFKQRSQRLMRSANGVLIIIVLVLVLSALFIVFAGYISRLGAQGLTTINNLTNERSNIETELTRLDEDMELAAGDIKRIEGILARTSERNTDRLDSTLNSRDDDILREILSRHRSNRFGAVGREPGTERPLTSIDAIALKERLATRLDNFKSLKKRKETDLTGVNALLTAHRSVGAEDGDAGNGNGQQGDSGTGVTVNGLTSILVAEGITRFGVLAIAIYLVQILINLYRYNTRLSAYYLAHYDSLLLDGAEPDKIENIHAVLWPDLHFGKQPTTIPNKIVDAFSTHLSKLGEILSRRGKDNSPGEVTSEDTTGDRPDKSKTKTQK